MGIFGPDYKQKAVRISKSLEVLENMAKKGLLKVNHNTLDKRCTDNDCFSKVSLTSSGNADSELRAGNIEIRGTRCSTIRTMGLSKLFDDIDSLVNDLDKL